MLGVARSPLRGVSSKDQPNPTRAGPQHVQKKSIRPDIEAQRGIMKALCGIVHEIDCYAFDENEPNLLQLGEDDSKEESCKAGSGLHVTISVRTCLRVKQIVARNWCNSCQGGLISPERSRFWNTYISSEYGVPPVYVGMLQLATHLWLIPT